MGVGELQEQVQRLEESVKDLKPQLGRTEALAGDLKEQVAGLRRGLQGDRQSIFAGCERDLEEAAAGAGRSETLDRAARCLSKGCTIRRGSSSICRTSLEISGLTPHLESTLRYAKKPLIPSSW